MVFLEIVLSFLALFIIFYWSYRRKALDFRGSIFALIFGLIIWHTQGFSFFLIILAFFILSYAATELKTSLKDSDKIEETRNFDNVISNGLVPFFSAIVGFDFLFFGAISSALADTLASEIGILSKRKPVMITNFREVLPGKDGGITILGLIISLLSGIFISFLVFVLAASDISIIYLMFILGIAGFIGSLFDSFLGATLERRGDLSNGSVNFISTLLGGLFALLLRIVLLG